MSSQGTLYELRVGAYPFDLGPKWEPTAEGYSPSQLSFTGKRR